MILLFLLTMPNRGSWNGGWSGSGNYFAIIRKTGNSKADRERAAKVLAHGSYYYRWDDGWGANVSVKEVSEAEARIARKKSKGFCGYDWMVDSIMERQKILADHEIKTEAEAA